MSVLPDGELSSKTSAGEVDAGLVIQMALDLGFDDGAFVGVQALRHEKEMRAAAARGLHGPLDYVGDRVEMRVDIRKVMPGAKSVLVLVSNYFTGDHPESRDPQAGVGAKIARYAWGADYHNVIRKRMRKLRRKILELYPNIKVAPFNDTKPVAERAWAEAAGLGFVGKSSMFIHRGLGTWTFLAGVVFDVCVEHPPPVLQTDLCGTCTKCIDACPTGAFVEPFSLDAGRCLSTWNIEKPLDVRAEHPDFTGSGWAFGCDICQEVCPWNKFQTLTSETRFSPKEGHVQVSEDTLPKDLTGTPLARAKEEGLAAAVRRALMVKGK